MKKPPNLEAFYDQFWYIRERRLNGDERRGKLKDFLRRNLIPCASDLVEASDLDRAADFVAAEAKLQSFHSIVPAYLIGLYHFILGHIYKGGGRLSQAVTEYSEAIRLAKDQKEARSWVPRALTNIAAVYAMSNAWSSQLLAIQCLQEAIANRYCIREKKARLHFWIGLIHASNYESDKAVIEFRTALASQVSPEIIGDIYAALGHEYCKLNDFDNALLAYERAINAPALKDAGRVWNNLGVALVSLRQWDRATDAFKSALKEVLPADRDTIHLNLAFANFKWACMQSHVDSVSTVTQYFAEAKNELRIVVKNGRSRKERQLAEVLMGLIRRGKGGLKSYVEQFEIRVIGSQALRKPEYPIVRKLNSGEIDAYQSYWRRDTPKENVFSVLRKWSSALPVLDGSARRWRGGGYFLLLGDLGIVVDPGFDFVQNFNDAGYSGKQIQYVVITHNHPDHNRDLLAIDDLIYELDMRKPPLIYHLLVDKDTLRAFRRGASKHRAGPTLLGKTQQLGPNVILQTLRARHRSADCRGALAFKFILTFPGLKRKTVIGYTGDTAWFPTLGRFLKGCDLLIAHMSSPTLDELRDPFGAPFKEYHLGYKGVCTLIEKVNPEITLVGEFWAGIADIRMEVIRAIRSRTEIEAIFPAAIGMRVNLPDLTIECGFCKKPKESRKIRMFPPKENFGQLFFRCSECSL